MDLTEATTILLDKLPPENRGRLIRHFAEGFPLASNHLRQGDAACLLGSAYSTYMDAAEVWWKGKYRGVTGAFDAHVYGYGLESARAVVIDAIRAWLREHQPVDEPHEAVTV